MTLIGDSRNKLHGVPVKPDSLSAICLSGGGIRSATFSFGCLQTLDRLGLIRSFDCLSTVSGGGYAEHAVLFALEAAAEDFCGPKGNRWNSNAQRSGRRILKRLSSWERDSCPAESSSGLQGGFALLGSPGRVRYRPNILGFKNRDRVAKSPQMKHLTRLVQRWSRPLFSYHEYMVCRP